MITLGFDCSLNHGAVVRCVDGRLDAYWYYTNVAGAAKANRAGTRQLLPKSNDKNAHSVARLVWVQRWLDGVLDAQERVDYAASEDYAVRAEQGAHYLGEVGGLVRLQLYGRKIPFRLHDPVTLKMFVTWNGTAPKDEMERAVLRRWAVDFGDCSPPAVRGKQNRTSSEDLADAFCLAHLAWVEACLRTGGLSLAELEHDKERQVFNRVTKTYPVSLLGREWITNAGAPSLRARILDRVRSSARSDVRRYLERLLGD